ncbi:hypothetical protein M427DRAFT_47998 [Gonapodya prolifera JEL478]|uniref:Uncharacterized protein n=1 Tax=Gonapodya prolifera (strain JEL478) TaxID=1344416 RepID=A0A139A197_GONPJ|nr:hypothetical protein M427DRAFT_47998 [Gonapodya prolifera JEL478]|eukprot:KXS10522.1 hypothetical protein M427DRAFT_47998 [Gonapodya prolifera JEL478]
MLVFCRYKNAFDALGPYVDQFEFAAPDHLHVVSKGVFGDHRIPMVISILRGWFGSKAVADLDKNTKFDAMDYNHQMQTLIFHLEEWFGHEDCPDLNNILLALRLLLSFNFAITAKAVTVEDPQSAHSFLRDFAAHMGPFERASKVHKLQEFIPQSLENGTSDNYSTAKLEGDHKRVKRLALNATNHKDFVAITVLFDKNLFYLGSQLVGAELDDVPTSHIPQQYLPVPEGVKHQCVLLSKCGDIRTFYDLQQELGNAATS